MKIIEAVVIGALIGVFVVLGGPFMKVSMLMVLSGVLTYYILKEFDNKRNKK